jgi:multidrug efflux pump subunit AcrA (membrane-fusion protein)
MRIGQRGAWWTGGALAALAVVALLVLVNRGGTRPVAATTTTVQRGTVSVALSAAGTVESSQTSGLGFALAGTLTEVNVRAGDMVTAGEVLARIDPTDAQAAVDSAAGRVDDAQQAVNKAAATAALPPCPTATATPSHAANPSESAHPTAAPSTAPEQTRAQPGSASPTCTTPGRGSTSDPLLAAQQQLNNAKLTLTQANARLAGTVITAPSAGRVIAIGGTVGQRVAGGTVFVELGDVSVLTVAAQFTEADVGQLAVGQPAEVMLPDRPDPLAGTVSQIDPAGTVSARLVRYGVVIVLNPTPEGLLLGQSATVRVTTASAENVLYLPSAAVIGVDHGAGRVTVRVGSHDEARTVRVGLRSDQYTEIQDGLAEGDVVVLAGSA